MNKIDKCGLDDLEYYRRRSFLLKKYLGWNLDHWQIKNLETLVVKDLTVFWHEFEEEYGKTLHK